MTRALSSTSGMKHSPVFMRAPTTSMPGSSAPSRISRALLALGEQRRGERVDEVAVALYDGDLELLEQRVGYGSRH